MVETLLLLLVVVVVVVVAVEKIIPLLLLLQAHGRTGAATLCSPCALEAIGWAPGLVAKVARRP